MNLADMKRRVYSVLRDSEKTFIEDGEVEDLLNEAYLDITARLRLLRKEATGTTSANGTVTLPSDFIEVVSLSVLASSSDSAEQPVEFVDDTVFDSWLLSGSTPARVLCRIFGGTIETYPVVVSSDYTLRYVYKGTTLDSVADEASLPAEVHTRMVNYARAHCKYKEGELEEGDRYMAMYEAGLPMPPRAGYRERPGPFNLFPVPTVWDLSNG